MALSYIKSAYLLLYIMSGLPTWGKDDLGKNKEGNNHISVLFNSY